MRVGSVLWSKDVSPSTWELLGRAAPPRWEVELGDVQNLPVFGMAGAGCGVWPKGLLVAFSRMPFSHIGWLSWKTLPDVSKEMRVRDQEQPLPGGVDGTSERREGKALGHPSGGPWPRQPVRGKGPPGIRIPQLLG